MESNEPRISPSSQFYATKTCGAQGFRSIDTALELLFEVGEWSTCDNGCGQRIRAVYCQSPGEQDAAPGFPHNSTAVCFSG